MSDLTTRWAILMNLAIRYRGGITDEDRARGYRDISPGRRSPSEGTGESPPRGRHRLRHGGRHSAPLNHLFGGVGPVACGGSVMSRRASIGRFWSSSPVNTMRHKICVNMR